MSSEQYTLDPLHLSPQLSYDHGDVEEYAVGGIGAARKNGIHEPLIHNKRPKYGFQPLLARPSRRAKTWSRIESFRKEVIFIGLTIIAAVMTVINFAQIFYIDSWGSKNWVHTWIKIFPSTVFAILVVVFIVVILLNRADIHKEWTAANNPDVNWRKRTAWIGVILSIVASVVICEFFYIVRVAVPRYNTTQWLTGLEVENRLPFPSFTVVTPAYMQLQSSGEYAECTFGERQCSMSKVENADDQFCYMSLDAANQPEGKALSVDVTKVLNVTEDGLNLDFWFDYVNGTGFVGTEPFYIVLYDQNIKFNWTDFSLGCGNQLIYHAVSIAPANLLNFELKVYVSQMNDTVGGLDAGISNADSICADAPSKYTYYTADVVTLEPGYPLVKSTCDQSLANYTSSCGAGMWIKPVSSLVTTQTSSPGTDIVEIFVDEGAIVGGVMFFTWFLGIFAI